MPKDAKRWLPFRPPKRASLFFAMSAALFLRQSDPIAPLDTFLKSTASIELTYTEFINHLERNNIVRVEFHAERKIKGMLKSGIINSNSAFRYQYFRVTIPFPSERLISRLEKKGVTIKVAKGLGFTDFLIVILPWLLLVGIWIRLVRKRRSKTDAARSFVQRRTRREHTTGTKVTFADVAGCDEAKQELQEIVEFLKTPEKFTRVGGKIPKGALLVGPPGTGKTLLAKAVAGEADRPFFSMSGSDFVEMFVGVGAARVRDLFEQGKEHAPCIIFIDEVDAVGRRRGAGLGQGHDEREQTLNQILVAMDGFESNENVIVLAATNRPDVLDPALLRPGRFDRTIIVDVPDARGRESILRIHCRTVRIAPDVRCDVLAQETPGFTGADLANLVNEAALLAARKSKTYVDMEDFEEARDKLTMGLRRQNLYITEEERRRSAYHEAGHTMVNLRMPNLDPIHKITIVPHGNKLGQTVFRPEQDRHNYTKEYILDLLAQIYGGRAAEELTFGPEHVSTVAAKDIKDATLWARRMVRKFGMSEKIGPVAAGDRYTETFLGKDLGHRRTISRYTAQLIDEEIQRITDEAYRRAKAIMEQERSTLDRIASTLLERETLCREELLAIADGKELPPKR